MSRKRDSKSLIMGAARAEFALAGYAGARVERIARKAGVNKQLIFYYFGSKQGLYRAALTTAAAEIAAQAGPAGAQPLAGARLRDTLESVLTRLAGRAEVLELLLHGNRTAGVPSQAAEQAFGLPLNQIRNAISAGQGVGMFRDEVDPDLLALQAAVLLIGYLALEPMLVEADRALSREAWLGATADTLTRAMAW
jgi:TetR/AcrR family transcriptional regulator